MTPSATHPGRFYGRGSELAVIEAEIARLEDGMGGVVLVEGGAGMGKSRLLEEVSVLARERGLAMAIAAADPGESVVELSTMLAALFGGLDPLLDQAELKGLHVQPEQRFWLLRDLQGLLERAALESPLVIAIDDAQWIDTGTLAALRTLPGLLSALPIVWLIALRPSRDSAVLAPALEQLQRDGATTIVLGPLDDDAVGSLTTEQLDAEPDEQIAELVDQAGGSPFLLVELLRGLREEGRVRILDGHAELLDRGLPQRLEDRIRDRLERLSEAAYNAVIVAASLGRTFTLTQLAQTLAWAPSDLVVPLDELLAANLLAERDDELAFWHDITREAVRACVPVSARRALDRQAADVLLAGGALPVEVAVQIAASAVPGDDAAIKILIDAAETLMTSDPSSAAHFAQRALEIAPPSHPRRGEIAGTTAIALHIAGNSDDAIAFADTALRQTLPAEQEAEVRLSIAGMFSISPEIRIATGRMALSLEGLPDVLRARHLASLFHNLVTAGRMDEARAMLDTARATVEASADVRASFTLRLAESALEYADDRFEPALSLVTAAYRDGIFAGDDQRLRLGHMWHGEVLSVLDRSEDAMAIAADGRAAAQRDRQGWAYQMFDTWHGRMLLRTGQLSEAAAVLEGRFDLEDGTHAVAVLDAAGIVALGRLAIHLGDGRQVRRLQDIAVVMSEEGGTPAVRRHAGWLLALFAMARDEPDVARERLRSATEPGGRPILPRFPLDVGDEVLLARIALAAEDDELVDLAVSKSRQRAASNPEAASVAAVAAHVRGLVERDVESLQLAVDLFERSPRRLEHASALEDLGTARVDGDRDAAVETLSRALKTYTEIGAEWDARRVRRRLRDLGLRRRIVTTGPPTEGKAALTASEVAVARLVAEGLTNREVAERLFVSPHTVNSHLRHVFEKLGITSRVELARLSAELDL